jgi:hypothetical protein
MKPRPRMLGAFALAYLALTALGLPALAEGNPLPFSPGERLTWDVHYGGVTAGTAWSEVRPAAGMLMTFSAGCRSAAWYEPIYAIDDEIESLWDSVHSGSSRYRTRFREGRFHQDQLMDIGTEGIRVWRNQEHKGTWEESVESYPAMPGPVEDPQTAFYRIRTLPLKSGTTWRFPVFSGKHTWSLDVSVSEGECMRSTLGPIPVLPVHIRTRHEGDLEQKGDILVYFSDDDRRIPLKLVIHTNVGAIRAELASYRPGARGLAVEKTAGCKGWSSP